MAGFDGEQYLRCRGEDSLRAADSDELWLRARALQAVGMVSDDVARTVLAGYRRARQIRDLEECPFEDHSDAVPVAEARRIVRLDRVVEQPWGTVTLRYLALGRNDVRVAVTMKFAASSASPGRVGPWRHYLPGGPPSVDITDDRGKTVSTGFGGGGSGKKWRGSFVADDGLAQDTRWVTILGERIDLVDTVAITPVTISTFDGASRDERAARYLDHVLEGGGDGETDTLRVAVGTLIACGAVPADSPHIARSYAVGEALWSSGSIATADLPERWRSVIEGRRRKRKHKDVRKASMILDVSTPLFDGLSVSMMQLDSGPDGFDIEVAGYGSIASAKLLGYLGASERTLTFTASDDVGNHYLGELSDFRGGGGTVEGLVRFVPPLHRDATELDVTLATAFAAATVHIVLDWKQRG